MYTLNFRKHSSRNKNGVAIAFFAVLTIVVIGLAALVVDISQLYSVKTRIKSALDQSVLAGISQLVNQSNISDAKNLALQYLNENLTMTFPSFNPLSLDSSNLSIQVGVYDLTNMIFNWNESSPNVNAIMISYTYKTMTIFGGFLGVNELVVSDSSVSVKQIAGRMPSGGGFPLAIERSVLPQARTNANMIDLVQSGTTNSFFTAFSSSNASTSDIKNILEYFKEQTLGVTPPSLAVGEEFQINNGNLTSVYMTLSDPIYIGKTFLSPIVKSNQNFINIVKVEGFIGFTINNIYMAGNDYHIAGTIIPNYVDNKWSGLIIGAGPGDIPKEDQSLLAVSYALAE